MSITMTVDANDLWEEVDVIDGVVCWKEDGTTPPPELLRLWEEQGRDFDYVLSHSRWVMAQDFFID